MSSMAERTSASRRGPTRAARGTTCRTSPATITTRPSTNKAAPPPNTDPPRGAWQLPGGGYAPAGNPGVPVRAISIPPIAMRPYASIWENLPAPIATVQPRPMEVFRPIYGLIVYETTLIGQKSGSLAVTEVHDYATVFVDGRYIGKLDRRAGEQSIALPRTASAKPVLTILVEAMGRINFAQSMIDRKGITDRVTLSGMTLMNWRVYPMPLSDDFILRLREGKVEERPGIFFRGRFDLAEPADTFLDLSGYQKGVVWVNGHNLGRYWDIGPQKRLYCPGVWLRAGSNEIVALDLHQLEGAAVAGFAAQE